MQFFTNIFVLMTGRGAMLLTLLIFIEFSQYSFKEDMQLSNSFS